MALNCTTLSQIDDSQPPPYSNLAQTIPADVVHKPAHTTTVVVQQIHPPTYGPKPQYVMCSSCKSMTMTKVKDKVSIRTHKMAIILALLSCCSCLLIPYCLSSCQNQQHDCENCGAYLGTFKN
ncbi:hypothetical protein PVAND_012476 [Polypedilum vanderplanki]|uniref:LITAF domain-containing protein n=1 Tax=Polypedilum vanderplanki TaxID=319348 RepID=A0A9J6CMM7_POLVA|nr:hypothetical protein PVAND_012476 [Polypedilum vanderplanki]